LTVSETHAYILFGRREREKLKENGYAYSDLFKDDERPFPVYRGFIYYTLHFFRKDLEMNIDVDRFQDFDFYMNSIPLSAA